MRKLKHHEQKLLRKVDFLQWKNEHNLRELQVRTVAAGEAQRCMCSRGSMRGPPHAGTLLSCCAV
jgi:hypothetical protein